MRFTILFPSLSITPSGYNNCNIYNPDCADRPRTFLRGFPICSGWTKTFPEFAVVIDTITKLKWRFPGLKWKLKWTVLDGKLVSIGLNSDVGESMDGLGTVLEGLGPKREMSVKCDGPCPMTVLAGFYCYRGISASGTGSGLK